MVLIKQTQKQKKTNQFIAGLGFSIIGLYMILSLKDVRGQLPLILGIGLLLWRF